METNMKTPSDCCSTKLDVFELDSSVGLVEPRRMSLRPKETTITETYLGNSDNEYLSSTSDLSTQYRSSLVGTTKVEIVTPKSRNDSNKGPQAIIKHGYLTPSGSSGKPSGQNIRKEDQLIPIITPPPKKRRRSALGDEMVNQIPDNDQTSQNAKSKETTFRRPRLSSKKQPSELPSLDVLDAKLRELIRCRLDEPPVKDPKEIGLVYVFKEKQTDQALSAGKQGPVQKTLFASKANPSKQFYHHEAPDLFKVGYTHGEADKRRKGIENECGISLETLVFTLQLPSPEAKRLEKLIHTYLDTFNANYLASYQQLCDCNTRHQEWFHLSIATLMQSIDMWYVFMKSKPYHPISRHLVPFWDKRLHLTNFGYAVRTEKNEISGPSQVHADHQERCKIWKNILEHSKLEGFVRHWSEFQQLIWNICLITCIPFFIITAFGPYYSALDPQTRGVWGNYYVAFVWIVLGFNPLRSMLYSNSLTHLFDKICGYF